MNRSGMRACRVLAFIAMLFGVMVTTLPLPAYGQQEVDPSWYNPWPATNTAVVHSSQPQAAIRRHQPVVRRVSTTQGARKLNAKQPTTQTAAVMTRLAK